MYKKIFSSKVYIPEHVKMDVKEYMDSRLYDKGNVIEAMFSPHEIYFDYPDKSEIKGTYDVIVLGGGPLGFLDAVDFLRRGLKVLLIDKADVGSEGYVPNVELNAENLSLQNYVKSGIFSKEELKQVIHSTYKNKKNLIRFPKNIGKTKDEKIWQKRLSNYNSDDFDVASSQGVLCSELNLEKLFELYQKKFKKGDIVRAKITGFKHGNNKDMNAVITDNGIYEGRLVFDALNTQSSAALYLNWQYLDFICSCDGFSGGVVRSDVPINDTLTVLAPLADNVTPKQLELYERFSKTYYRFVVDKKPYDLLKMKASTQKRIKYYGNTIVDWHSKDLHHKQGDIWAWKKFKKLSLSPFSGYYIGHLFYAPNKFTRYGDGLKTFAAINDQLSERVIQLKKDGLVINKEFLNRARPPMSFIAALDFMSKTTGLESTTAGRGENLLVTLKGLSEFFIVLWGNIKDKKQKNEMLNGIIRPRHVAEFLFSIFISKRIFSAWKILARENNGTLPLVTSYAVDYGLTLAEEFKEIKKHKALVHEYLSISALTNTQKHKLRVQRIKLRRHRREFYSFISGMFKLGVTGLAIVVLYLPYSAGTAVADLFKKRA